MTVPVRSRSFPFFSQRISEKSSEELTWIFASVCSRLSVSSTFQEQITLSRVYPTGPVTPLIFNCVIFICFFLSYFRSFWNFPTAPPPLLTWKFFRRLTESSVSYSARSIFPQKGSMGDVPLNSLLPSSLSITAPITYSELQYPFTNVLTIGASRR